MRPGRGPVAVIALGCPKNLVDSEVMAALVGRAGLTLTSDPAEAAAIIVNTCAFIRPAREEAWERIAEAAELRRRGSCRVLVVAGCLAERFAEEIRERFPEVDGVFGTGEVEEAAAALALGLGRGPGTAGLPARSAGSRLPPGYLPGSDIPRLVSTPRPYAYLKIAEGCGHRCSFCLIPSLRGPYRSRRPEDIVAEARALGDLGVRELILVAQDTTAYGRDLAGKPLLAPLVRRLLDSTDLAWLRVLYAHPGSLPDEFVDLLAEESGAANPAGGRRRLCRYLDLPMQHASDRILRAMRRSETRRSLTALVKRLRDRVPGLTLRSTFIVGFPGETDDDFHVLLDFLRETRLEHAGFFAYSPEEGTAAAGLPGQVPEDEKAERLAAASALQRGISLEWRRQLVGRRLRVIVDGEVVSGRRGRSPGSPGSGPDGAVKEAGAGSRRGVRRPVRVVARAESDAPEIDGRVIVTTPADRTSGPWPPAPGDFLEVTVTGAGPYDLTAVHEPGGSSS